MREQTARHRKTEKKKGSALATLCILTLLAFVLSTGAVSLARYALELREEDVATAAPFYFTSDCLSADDPPPHTVLTAPASGDTVEIKLNLSNYIDDLRYSGETINYSYALYVEINGTLSMVSALQTGELTGGSKKDNQITLLAERSDLEVGPVTVIAKATKPYEKELKGTFGFAEGEVTGLQKDVREENGAVVLELIGNIPSGKRVEITWPEELIPDRSCELFDDIDGNFANVFGMGDGRCALIFLKTDPDASYEASDFTVTKKY